MADFSINIENVTDTATKLASTAEELRPGAGLNTADSCKSKSVIDAMHEAADWTLMSRTRTYNTTAGLGTAAKSAADAQRQVDAAAARAATIPTLPTPAPPTTSGAN